MNAVRGKTYALLFLLVVLIAAFNALWRLDAGRVEDWDEARRGVAAKEMLESGNYVVHTYRGRVDYWSLKPPLGYWLIAASFRVFGKTVFALRLPSALSAIGAVAALMLALHFRRERPAALVAGTILATCVPFFVCHSARTGDFDAQLVFLICLAAMALESPLPPRARFGLAGLCVALSFLLKGMAVVYIAAILSIWLAVAQKRLKLRRSHVLALAGAAVAPILVYGFFRCRHDGFDFFRIMVRNDAMTRPFTAIEGHTRTFWYLFKRNVLKYHWYWFLLCAFSAVRLRSRLNGPALGRYALYIIWAVVPLAGTALWRSRVAWYLNPAYPGIAAVCGIVIARYLREGRRSGTWGVVYAVALAAAVVTAETRMVRKLRREYRSPAQRALLSLPSAATEGANIYSAEWSQSNVFVAEVLLGLSCRECRIDRFAASAANRDLFLSSAEDAGTAPLNLVPVAGNEEYVVLSRERSEAE